MKWKVEYVDGRELLPTRGYKIVEAESAWLARLIVAKQNPHPHFWITKAELVEELVVEEKQPPELFVGLEETNIQEFLSRCCSAGLSIEPLCRIACGQCGKTIAKDNLLYVGLGEDDA